MEILGGKIVLIKLNNKLGLTSKVEKKCGKVIKIIFFLKIVCKKGWKNEWKRLVE